MRPVITLAVALALVTPAAALGIELPGLSLVPPSAPVVVAPGAEFDESKPLREAFTPRLLDGLAPTASVAVAEASPTCEPSGDAGSGFESAQPLVWPTVCEGTIVIDEYLDSDWYALSVAAPTWLIVTLRVPEGADLGVCVFDETWRGDCSDFGGSWDERVEYPADNGTWYVSVYSYANASYVLEVASGQPPAPEDDCGTGADASDSRGAPTDIAYPVDCGGRITDYDRDVYALTLPAGVSFETLLAPSAFGDFDICVFGPTGEVYDCSFADGPGLPERILTLTDEAGVWTVVVDWWAGRGDYLLKAQGATPPLPQDDCGLGIDAGWRSSAPTQIPFPVSCAGVVADGDRFDWFSVDLADEDYFEAAFMPSPGTQLDLCIFHPRGYVTDCVARYDDAPATLLGGGANGTWYVVAYAVGMRGAYALDLEPLARPTQDDCGSGGDAGDHADEARPVTLAVSCAGLLHDLDNFDWYVADVPPDTWVRASATFGDGIMGAVCINYLAGGGCDWDGDEVAPTGEGGNMTFLVYRQTQLAAYDLVLEFAPPPPVQSDCGTGTDLAYGNAYDIGVGQTCAGVLAEDYGDEYDDFQHYDGTAEGIVLQITSEQPLYVCAYDAHYEIECAWTDNGTLRLDAEWAWYVRVYGDGAYAITLAGVWRTQEARAPILIGQNLTEEPIASDPNGTLADGMWVELDQVAVGGETLEAAARTGGVLFDIGRVPGSTVELTFHDGAFTKIGEPCTVTAADTPCAVPVGAAWVFVTAKDGARWDVGIRYRYLDV